MKCMQKCNCGSTDIDWGWNLHYIPGTNPPEVGQEGQCLTCYKIFYIKFRAYEITKRDEDEYGNLLNEEKVIL